MNIAVSGLVVWLALTELPVGTELQYAGTLSQQSKTGAVDVKSFTIHATTILADDGSSQLAYYLDERGGGSWGWPERYGLMPTADATSMKFPPMRILYTHESQQYPLVIRSPLFPFREKLMPQSAWADGKYEYVVTRTRTLKKRSGFQIEVSTNLGRSQTLVVEAETGILLSLDERVIIGRGDEFQLKMELQSQEQLAAADAAKFQQALDSLLNIRAGLNRTGEQKVIELTSDQLNSIRKELPRIETESENTSLSRLVASIARDLQQQQKRLEGVAGLQKKLVGQPSPEWKVKLIDGRTVSAADFKGQVVVLHFWQYRSEPLSEPYGQVGYLDFLSSKRKKLGVAVIGINVDERFANPQQKAVANRSMRGLLDFMKLGYDMGTDDGTILAEFGDPRSLGAPLPLWLVIGHDGKVTHSHTGFYDIKPDEGLKPLDDAVVEAVRRQKNE